MLARREDDGSDHPEPRIGIDFIPGDGPGQWRQDPISKNPLALGAHWGEVDPFVLQSSDQFRVPPPPALSSRAYAVAFDEVKALGGDGIVIPTSRTDDQTFAGIFWAYDGTPSLCAPPRLYNQITVRIAEQQGTRPLELARLLALNNVAMADAGITIWESKYFYKLWRPVTGIREADRGTGPTGSKFTPLGAPASNLTGPNFTPPFPAYPSATPASAVRCSRCCETSTGPTASRSRSYPTSSTARPSTTRATCARSCRGDSPRCPRPKRKMARAASTGHPLGVRQDPGHRAGPAYRRLRVPAGLRASAPLSEERAPGTNILGAGLTWQHEPESPPPGDPGNARRGAGRAGRCAGVPMHLGGPVHHGGPRHGARGPRRREVVRAPRHGRGRRRGPQGPRGTGGRSGSGATTAPLPAYVSTFPRGTRWILALQQGPGRATTRSRAAAPGSRSRRPGRRPRHCDRAQRVRRIVPLASMLAWIRPAARRPRVVPVGPRHSPGS